MIATLQIFIPVLVAIISAWVSYKASVKKSQTEIEAIKMNNEARINEIEAQSKADIEKLEKELEKKAEYDEKSIINDLSKDAASKIFSGEMDLGKFMQMGEEFKKMQGKK